MRIKMIIFNVVFVTLFISIACQKRQMEVTTSSPEARKLYTEGIQFAEKFYDLEAIEKFQQAIDLDSSFAMAYYYLSRSYESAGNLAEARTSIEKASKFSGITTPIEWMYISAWEKILDTDYQGAIDIYNDILKDYPNDNHTLFVMGKTLRLMKSYKKSIAVLKKLIKQMPDYAPAYNQLGYVYKEMGDFVNAMAAFHQYSKLEPDEPNPYDSLGDMYRAQGQYRQAIEHYHRALEVKPDFYTSYRNLALCYFECGKYDLAISTLNDFEKQVRDREWHRDINSDLVQVYIALGEYENALDYARQTVELSQTKFRKSWAVATIGYIHYLKNNFSEALNQLNLSLTILPEAIWAREWRGLVFLAQNKFDESLAEADMMKSLIDKYGLKGFQSNYFSLLGNIAIAQGLYDEAIMYFNDAVQSGTISARYSLAKAYFLKNDYSKAEQICQHIFALNSNHALTHLLLSQIYIKQNKEDQASLEYQRFKNIWKNADQLALKINVPQALAAK